MDFYALLLLINQQINIMATLDVQRKKKSPLLWILLTLLVLAIVGYLIWRQYNDPNTATPLTSQDSINRVEGDTITR
jgi:hypothetical protein